MASVAIIVFQTNETPKHGLHISKIKRDSTKKHRIICTRYSGESITSFKLLGIFGGLSWDKMGMYCVDYSFGPYLALYPSWAPWYLAIDLGRSCCLHRSSHRPRTPPCVSGRRGCHWEMNFGMLHVSRQCSDMYFRNRTWSFPKKCLNTNLNLIHYRQKTKKTQKCFLATLLLVLALTLLCVMDLQVDHIFEGQIHKPPLKQKSLSFQLPNRNPYPTLCLSQESLLILHQPRKSWKDKFSNNNPTFPRVFRHRFPASFDNERMAFHRCAVQQRHRPKKQSVAPAELPNGRWDVSSSRFRGLAQICSKSTW